MRAAQRSMARACMKVVYISAVFLATCRLTPSRTAISCSESTSMMRWRRHDTESKATCVTLISITSRSFTPFLNTLKSSCQRVI